MQNRKDKQKEAGLKEIRIEIQIKHEKLVRTFAQKLKTGELMPGDVIRIE